MFFSVSTRKTEDLVGSQADKPYGNKGLQMLRLWAYCCSGAQVPDTLLSQTERLATYSAGEKQQRTWGRPELFDSMAGTKG